MSRCRSCGAEIVWVETEQGRRMPLDAVAYTGPEPGGLFVRRADRALGVGPDVFPDEPHFRSHFTTCPQADAWRRQGGS